MPWWWWPVGFAVGTLLAAEVHLGYPGLRAWLPYLLMVLLVSVALVGLSRYRVVLSGDQLQVGPARIPVQYLGQIEVIHPDVKRRALGPELDPAAFVLHRGWVGPVLRVRITDPADPTPYWIFSVRRAEELAKLLRERAQPHPRGSSQPQLPNS